MKKLRIGVIGLGIGRHHIQGFQKHPDAEVVAIADVDERRLKEIGDQYNVPSRFTSAADMLANEKLDVATVATPNKFHAPLARASFQAGCHVLCEKPMAMTAVEGQQMVQAARKAGKRLMINLSYRFTEQGWALKTQVDEGMLGEVYFARTVWHRRRGLPGFGGWFGQKELSGGGPLIDLGVHRIDLALWLMGYPKPVWVLGNTYNAIGTRLAREQKKKYDVEDLAAALIRFDNGAMLAVEASWAANIAERELMETRLLGTKGGLVHRNRGEGYEFEAELYVERAGCQWDLKLHPPVPQVPSAQYHFIDCILHNRPHTATGEEALTVQELLDAIYRSAARGRPVQIRR